MMRPPLRAVGANHVADALEGVVNAALDDLDLSRISAAPGARSSRLPFRTDRGFPAQSRMPTARVMDAVDVVKDGGFGLSARFPNAPTDQLGLYGLEDGFDCGANRLAAPAELCAAMPRHARASPSCRQSAPLCARWPGPPLCVPGSGAPGLVSQRPCAPVIAPATGSRDHLIQRLAGMVEPCGAGVVAVGQGAFFQLLFGGLILGKEAVGVPRRVTQMALGKWT